MIDFHVADLLAELITADRTAVLMRFDKCGLLLRLQLVLVPVKTLALVAFVLFALSVLRQPMLKVWAVFAASFYKTSARLCATTLQISRVYNCLFPAVTHAQPAPLTIAGLAFCAVKDCKHVELLSC